MANWWIGALKKVSIGSCYGKEEAEDQSVGSDRSVGSCCAKEKVENRAVGSCRGKGIVVAWSS